MKLLAVDTSGPISRWMGVTEEGLLDPQTADAGQKHDAALAKGMQEWLARNGREGLDAVAVVVGPGGFTGLRVGVAFAVGLAESLRLPVVPVSSYELLAASVDDGIVWALPFASRGEVRGRWMKGGAEPVPISEIELYSSDEPPVITVDGQVIPLGEGYQREKKWLDGILGERRLEVVTSSDEIALARASAAGFRAGRLLLPHEVDVDYGAEFRPTPKKES